MKDMNNYKPYIALLVVIGIQALNVLYAQDATGQVFAPIKNLLTSMIKEITPLIWLLLAIALLAYAVGILFHWWDLGKTWKNVLIFSFLVSVATVGVGTLQNLFSGN